MSDNRMLIPVHDGDLVLYAVATPAAMREAMVRAFEYAKGRCFPPGEVELIDEETGEVRTRQLRIVIGPDPDPMTVKQRRFYHGVVLKQIAEQARDEDGRAYEPKVWKEYMRKRFLGTNGMRWESFRMPGERRARPHAVRISTEDLSVKQYSELIEQVMAFAATDLGVTFQVDPREREEVRWKRRPRKRAAAPAVEREAMPA